MVVFIKIQSNIGILVTIAIFLLSFQASISGLKFIHINETCLDKSSGIAQLFLFISIMAVALAMPSLVNGLGTDGMFIFFSVTTLIGNLYIKFFMIDSTYKITKDGKVRLTDKEKKELYHPKDEDKVISLTATNSIE